MRLREIKRRLEAFCYDAHPGEYDAAEADAAYKLEVQKLLRESYERQERERKEKLERFWKGTTAKAPASSAGSPPPAPPPEPPAPA